MVAPSTILPSITATLELELGIDARLAGIDAAVAGDQRIGRRIAPNGRKRAIADVVVGDDASVGAEQVYAVAMLSGAALRCADTGDAVAGDDRVVAPCIPADAPGCRHWRSRRRGCRGSVSRSLPPYRARPDRTRRRCGSAVISPPHFSSESPTVCEPMNEQFSMRRRGQARAWIKPGERVVQQAVRAVEGDAVDIDHLASGGGDERAAAAEDQLGSAGKAQQAGAGRQVDFGHHVAAWWQKDRTILFGRLVQQLLDQPSLIAGKVRSHTVLADIERAAQTRKPLLREGGAWPPECAVAVRNARLFIPCARNPRASSASPAVGPDGPRTIEPEPL